MTIASHARRQRLQQRRSLSARFPEPPRADPQAAVLTQQIGHIIRASPATDDWKLAALVNVCATALRAVFPATAEAAAEGFGKALLAEVRRAAGDEAVADPSPAP